MKAETKHSYLLELTDEEAYWLKEQMQNPLHGLIDPSLESERDKDMRQLFWNALCNMGVK